MVIVCDKAPLRSHLDCRRIVHYSIRPHNRPPGAGVIHACLEAVDHEIHSAPLLETAQELDQQLVDLRRSFLLNPVSGAWEEDFLSKIRQGIL